MSEEGKDLKAAEKEFLEIFEVEDKEASKKVNLFKFFFKGFKETYSMVKSEMVAILNSNHDLNYEYFILECFNTAATDMQSVVRRSSMTVEDVVITEGKAFAYFSVGVDAVVSEFMFKPEINKRLTSRIMDNVETISANLKLLNKHIRNEAIERRIRQIARKRARKLTGGQKQLLASIAAAFK